MSYENTNIAVEDTEDVEFGRPRANQLFKSIFGDETILRAIKDYDCTMSAEDSRTWMIVKRVPENS